MKTWDNHPAKFSDEILAVIKPLVKPHHRVLDPFAGTGRVHELGARSIGIDIEPEAVAMHAQNMLGNALYLPFADGSFDAIVTSPCYGNRMADKHNARERCKACKGEGTVPEVLVGSTSSSSSPPSPPPALSATSTLTRSATTSTVYWSVSCRKCKGLGYRKYKRYTYTHTLGRRLHEDNSGGMQWGRTYRAFHQQAWIEAVRVLAPGGCFIVNTSNHIRARKEVPVTEWHHEVLVGLGLSLVREITVETKRMKNGANRDARVGHETVGVFRR